MQNGAVKGKMVELHPCDGSAVAASLTEILGSECTKSITVEISGKMSAQEVWGNMLKAVYEENS